MIFVSVSLAFFILPVPSICPTMIATASPMAINVMWERLVIVLAMLRAATTFNPRRE